MCSHAKAQGYEILKIIASGSELLSPPASSIPQASICPHPFPGRPQFPSSGRANHPGSPQLHALVRSFLFARAKVRFPARCRSSLSAESRAIPAAIPPTNPPPAHGRPVLELSGYTSVERLIRNTHAQFVRQCLGRTSVRFLFESPERDGTDRRLSLVLLRPRFLPRVDDTLHARRFKYNSRSSVRAFRIWLLDLVCVQSPMSNVSHSDAGWYNENSLMDTGRWTLDPGLWTIRRLSHHREAS